MAPEAFQSVLRQYGAASYRASESAPIVTYSKFEGTTTVIVVRGPMTKHGSYGTTSTAIVRADVEAAAKNPRMKSILLRIDSYGGSPVGIYELNQMIRWANRIKPVTAFIEDAGAAAAYWAALGASRIVANAPAAIGGIGSYGVLIDSSVQAARAGIKTIVVRAGKFKGVGEPGTTITAEQLAEYQMRVDAINQFFVEALAEGRNIPKARAMELSDGRIYTAAAAQKIGLIDGISSYDETLKALNR